MSMIFFRKPRLRAPTLNEDSSEFEINKWLVSDFIVKKLVPRVGVRPFPLDEQMLMVEAVCIFKPTLIFEWGTHIGKSARVFYETSKAFNIPCQIHSIDLPEDVFHGEHPHRDRGKLVRRLKGVTLHQADGLTRAFEILDRSSQMNQSVLFFVDGDHAYETVRRELSEILKHVPDAKVLLHDTFYQSADSGYNIGPYQAIEDVLGGLKDKYYIKATQTGLPGMTLVYRA